MIWDFIQNQILGMKWLNKLIGDGLGKIGLDISDQLGGSIQFFIYDVIKITLLLCVLIYLISYIQSYFPPERSKKNTGKISWNRSELYRSPFRNGNTILFLFLHSSFYRIYKCRSSAGSNLFLFDFLPYGRLGQPGAADEYFRN